MSVAIFATFCGCDAHSSPNPDHSDRDKTVPIEWKRFESHDPAFTIRYPPNWRVWQADRMLSLEPPDRKAAITVNVAKTTVTVDEAADRAITAAFSDATEMSVREAFVIDEMYGVCQEFSRPSGNGMARWIAVFLKLDDRVAAITTNGPVDVIAQDRAEFQKIMRSFRFR